jgi:hypothetical protein
MARIWEEQIPVVLILVRIAFAEEVIGIEMLQAQSAVRVCDDYGHSACTV